MTQQKEDPLVHAKKTISMLYEKNIICKETKDIAINFILEKEKKSLSPSSSAISTCDKCEEKKRLKTNSFNNLPGKNNEA